MYRVGMNVARLLILVAIVVILGGGWYLAKRGFGRQWRYRVAEELHKHGVEASIGRLTLDPFRGLVANNVRIFDYKNREKTLALISEVSPTRTSGGVRSANAALEPTQPAFRLRFAR